MSDALAKKAAKEIRQRVKAAKKSVDISFAGAGLRVVPGSVCEKLVPFKRIDLTGNSLTTFPPEVYQWKQLAELILGASFASSFLTLRISTHRTPHSAEPCLFFLTRICCC